MEITHFGSGICSYRRRITGAIFCETRPAMIIRSDWRGEGRNTSAPKRAISKRDAPIAIISMAQQARPNVIGQMELLRIQFTTLSSDVRMIPSGTSSPKFTSSTRRRLFCIFSDSWQRSISLMADSYFTPLSRPRTNRALTLDSRMARIRSRRVYAQLQPCEQFGDARDRNNLYRPTVARIGCSCLVAVQPVVKLCAVPGRSSQGACFPRCGVDGTNQRRADAAFL